MDATFCTGDHIQFNTRVAIYEEFSVVFTLVDYWVVC